MQAAIQRFTDARFSGPFFFALLALAYGLIPAYLGITTDDPYMSKLAIIAGVAAVSGLIGFYLPLIDWQFTERGWRIPVHPKVLHALIWGGFAVFVIVTFVTADSIPLLTALGGKASLVELDQARAAFLKTREGWEVALGYLSGAFTGAILPYSISALFCSGSKFRYPALAAFFLYAESFLQKALFLQIVIPLAYLVMQRRLWNYFGLAALLLVTLAVLYANTVLARGTDQFSPVVEQQGPIVVETIRPDGTVDRRTITRPPRADFFSSKFHPQSNVEHLLWRAFAVPVFTARDALIVHDQLFDGRPLMGATSTFVAAVAGLDRVNFDAWVHGYQWGETEIGRSNSVFLTEAFVNFGWLGVVLFALIVGQCFRWFWKSEDIAFKAMWPLFAYNIIQASLIGSMLSSGFAALFLIGLFFRAQAQTKAVPAYV